MNAGCNARDDAALRRADADARRLARRVFDRPLVLEAGAGTGKTSVLVSRLVAWLLGPGWERAEAAVGANGGGAAPDPSRVAARALERVVAITFTEAAAAEMAERLEQALAGIETRDAPPELADVEALELPSAVSRARALRLSLDRLSVQTIHAWCRRLLLEHPFEAALL